MVTVDEALQIIRNQAGRKSIEEIDFKDCLGRVLTEDIIADRDFPPYHRAAMDGVAIAFQDFEGGFREFKILGEQIAGIAQLTLSGQGTCVEIMTGAILPHGADTIIRYEDTEIQNGLVKIHLDDLKPGTHIHRQGTDALKDAVVIPFGKVINIGDIGIITSVGKTKLKVLKMPKVAVISTGNELVEPHEMPDIFQIRKSNVYTLSAMLKAEGINHQLFHFNDDLEQIKQGLLEIVKDFDVLMLSGGVSMGKKDFIPEALKSVGVEQHFHRVKQRPGKPLWFGSSEQVTVFGFPGNPVSTLVCYAVYFREWLSHSLNKPIIRHQAKLSEHIEFKPDLTYFMPVALRTEGAQLLAIAYKGSGSGDLVNLSKTDAFLRIPQGRDFFEEGEILDLVYPM